MTSGNSKAARTTEIDLPKPYRSDGGHGYKAALDSGRWALELAQLGDSNEKPRQSSSILLEDGKPIGRPHASHPDIREQGGGLFSHWSSTLYFSTSDNTDPNENSRTYTLLIDRDFESEQRLETTAIDFLRTRLAELGENESGFYNYYAHFAKTGTAFQFYDKAVVRFVLDHARHYERYVEIGAGIGQLSALLAAEGLRAIAVEGDAQRVKAAIALHQALSRQIDSIQNNMSVIESFFPDEKVTIDNQTLILFTNIIHSANKTESLLAPCRNAGGIILDACRFARSRTTTEEWRTLIRQVRDLGFPYVDPVFSWGDATLENQESPSPGRLLYFHRGPQLSPSPPPA